MKNVTRLVLITAVCLVMGPFLSACAPESKVHGAQPELQNPGTPDLPKGPSTGGTSDSGGGAGVEGKVFESYAVDPLTLPAYKNHLKTFFDQLKTEEDDSDEGMEMGVHFKTWYIAPVELRKIEKESLGVSFMSSQTDQIALQTRNEVWIDQSQFKKMSEKERAELILHELVMSFYFLKFYKFNEICEMAQRVDPNGDYGYCTEDLNKHFPPAEKLRPLNSKDNENIRAVTSWISKNLNREVSKQELFTLFRAYDFDSRLFNEEQFLNEEEKVVENIKISEQEVISVLKASNVSKQIPHFCDFEKLNNKDQICEVLFNQPEEMVAPFKSLNLMIKIGSEERKYNLRYHSFEELPSSHNEKNQVVFALHLYDENLAPKVGERVNSVVIYFKKSERMSAGFRVHSILVKPGVFLSQKVNEDKTIECKSQAFNPTQIWEDGIIIRAPENIPSLMESFMLEQMPFTMCMLEN